MKKTILLILCLCLLAGSVMAADYSVTRLTADCQVAEDGGLEISQKIEVNIENPVEEILLPVAKEGKKFSVESGKAKIVRRDGNVYARIRPGEEFTGNVTVTVAYHGSGVVTGTSQGQHFSAQLVSDLWEQPVQRFLFNVTLPKETASSPSYFSGMRQDDVEDDLTVAQEGRVISGILRGGMNDRESFSVEMDVPEGYFSVRTATGKSVAGQWILSILSILIAVAAGWYWFRFLRSGRLQIQARTTPPEGMTPAEIPFLLACGKPDFALLVCHWGALGYLTVTVNSAGRVLLRKCMDMGTERREEEKKLFDLLFGSSDVCQAGETRYRRVAELGAGVLRQYWSRRLYDRQSGSPLLVRVAATLVSALALMNSMIILLPAGPLKWLFVITAFVAGGACGTALWYGVIRFAVRDYRWMGLGAGAFLFLYLMARLGGGMPLMLLALVLCVAVGYFTCHGGRRTASGSDVVEQVKGFARFLGHAEDRHLVMMLQRDGQYFYRMMLFATACGLGRAFARRLSGAELEPCGFLTLSGKVSNSPYPYYLQFEELLKQLR